MEVDDFKDCIENIRHEELISEKQCRLCLKLCNSQYSLFGDGTNMVQKLMAFANVQVSYAFLAFSKILIKIVSHLFSFN